MKLFHKIFLCFVIIFGITFQVAGYLLINYAYENALAQSKTLAFQDFQYNRYILQSILYSEPHFLDDGEAQLKGISTSFTVPAAVCDGEGKCIFSNMALSAGELELGEGKKDGLAYRLFEKDGEGHIYVWDYVTQDEKGMYLITQTDIGSVLEGQKNMISYFQRIYLVILCICFPVVFLLTQAVTAPIKRVGKAARRIAGGKYSGRIRAKGRDEISELARDFNRMAQQVEEKIEELSDVARQKEDFAANFAHELKTPLTSVIGYADMLYQRDLPREEVKSAAEYILNEGMRLETLSLKLMDLFVLDKQDFLLERMSVREMFRNLEQGMEAVCGRRNAALHLEIEEGYVEADYDFFKTMILNLIDNSVKADSRDVWVSGENYGDSYMVSVTDNGKGIPPGELGRITEAFYMVDKSRSRKQHGAGLGMALVARIVELHRAKMKIESDGKTGTRVRIVFASGEENGDE